MSALPLPRDDGGGRYPGFDTVGQSRHWDAHTAEVVLARLRDGGPPGFFDKHELATCRALVDRLLAQDGEPRIPVEIMIDKRMAAGETDGWHYEDMPEDGEAWRRTLAHLDADAALIAGGSFADATSQQQSAVIGAVQDLGSAEWHGLNAARVWSLWTRYATTAFYSHPWAWDEIGFAGPAYPRGYKNLGIDRREPFEVADAIVREDPARR